LAAHHGPTGGQDSYRVLFSAAALPAAGARHATEALLPPPETQRPA